MEEQKETAAQKTGMGAFLLENSQGSFYLGKAGKSYTAHCSNGGNCSVLIT